MGFKGEAMTREGAEARRNRPGVTVMSFPATPLFTDPPGIHNAPAQVSNDTVEFFRAFSAGARNDILERFLSHPDPTIANRARAVITIRAERERKTHK